ncbi:DUF4136 domain-containing protein [Lysobacter cavernae]|uniref:DUF4136 domain-containing protein n=1 Tax=Lysobacter cavernae TaxID=1685901 RepID=A0ABV7RNW8_9GAMM
MKQFALAAVMATMLVACASTPTVHTDSDPSAQFASYHTYTWLAKPEGTSPLVQQRIVDGIDAQLRAKGWTQAADGDVSLAAHVATSQKQSLDTFYSGGAWGGWGWRGGMGMGSATTTVRTYDVGTLVVDMFDSKTKQAVWRGTASGTVPSSPEKVNASVQAGIDKMFASFPPGSAPAK